MKSLAAIICLLIAPATAFGQTYAEVISYPTVEGHWKFQDNEANTDVDNEAGPNATITVGGNTNTWSVLTGPTSWLPRAFNFPGSQRVDLGETITLTGASTVSFWANKDADATMGVIAGTDSNNKFQFDGTSFFRVTVAGSGSNTALSQTLMGQWHHYSVVLQTDATWDVYVDGALEVDGATGIPTAPFSMPLDRIGRVSVSVSYFDGRMAELIVHSEALDAGEVAALYNGPSGAPSLNLPAAHHYRQQMMGQ